MYYNMVNTKLFEINNFTAEDFVYSYSICLLFQEYKSEQKV